MNIHRFWPVIIPVLFFNFSAKAQIDFGSIALEAAAPVNDFAEILDMGLGFSIQYEHDVGDRYAAIIGGGYIHYMDNNKEVSTNQIPVYLAFRFYVNDEHTGFFGQLRRGFHVTRTRYDVADIDVETEFWHSLAPEIGYFFTETFSVSARYQVLIAPDRDRYAIDVDHLVPVTEKGEIFEYVGARFAYSW